MKRIVSALLWLEGALCIAFMAVMVFAVFLQVINRNFFKIPTLDWTEEAARFAMVVMALLATQIGVRQGKQMSIEFFTGRCSARTVKWIDFFADFCCFVFALVTFLSSFRIIRVQLNSGQVSSALGIPMVYMYAAVTASFFVMAAGKLAEMVSYFTTGSNPHSRI